MIKYIYLSVLVFSLLVSGESVPTPAPSPQTADAEWKKALEESQKLQSGQPRNTETQRPGLVILSPKEIADKKQRVDRADYWRESAGFVYDPTLLSVHDMDMDAEKRIEQFRKDQAQSAERSRKDLEAFEKREAEMEHEREEEAKRARSSAAAGVAMLNIIKFIGITGGAFIPFIIASLRSARQLQACGGFCFSSAVIFWFLTFSPLNLISLMPIAVLSWIGGLVVALWKDRPTSV